ncbi:amino acid adenylation domain-containing protein [Dactylosporangium sp. NPDC048998]|uniref:non-ribosomal peptide synthetase n=1 Tax=Dactylosporangium sp. NPDC048998 TaxID=3363976 RepID=UPI003717A6C3
MTNVEDIYALSPTQEGMLFHTVTAADKGLYVELTSFRVGGELPLSRLTDAWQRVVDRHPVLRTAFVSAQVSAPQQVVLAHAALPVAFHDLTGLPVGERAAAAEAAVDRLRGQPFDLTRPPLMRLLVLGLPDEYLVAWSYHHLLLDGWSAALLLAEVAEALQEPAGAAPPARPAPPPYREYIRWLRQRDTRADREFWSRYLDGYREPATPTLAGIRPGSRPSGTFRTVRAELQAEQVAALRRLAVDTQTTLGGLVEAAWAGTVARYCGRDDVVVGVTTAGRPAAIARFDEMIGMFINTIPVRVRVDPAAPARQWLAAHAAGRHPVLDHQHTPLPDIQRWGGLGAGTALFDTVLVFESYPDRTAAVFGDGQARVTDVRYETRTNYPVTLVVRVGATIRLEAVVDAALFTGGEAESLLDHLGAALRRLAVDPGQPVRAVFALPEADRALLVERWNGALVDRTEPRAMLPALIDEAVALRPDHPAVVDEHLVLTYRDLDRRADALAATLAGHGVRPGDRLGVCLGRQADLVTALLGCARAGAAFVPLDPTHPAERNRFVLDDAEPSAVLVDATGAPALAGWAGPVVDLSTADWRAAEPVVGRADGNGLAYVIYTSGSTGRPKGVAVGGRALANLVDSLARRHPGLGPDDRFLALTTLTFDTSLAELLVPLAVGATVHVGGGALRLNGQELDRYVTSHGITAVQATPSRYRIFIDSGWQGAGRPRLYSCGEAFPPDLAVPLAERGSSVWNMYGPTETTVYSSVERIHSETTRITVGRPISNTTMYVLDPHDQPAPHGCVGELCTGGAGVADGYWRRPELTAQRFVADPFRPGGRMYRTGDHARYLPDGRLELLGRIDRQVKLNGYRIEPGEIEAVLLTDDRVGAAAVAVRGGRLTAYVVAADPAASPTAEQLRATLRRLLPSYMIPEAFVDLPALPMTLAGKTDLLALPDPPVEAATPGPAAAPVGDIDALAQLAKLVQDVLGVSGVGPDDDFFELGGDSLRALRLVSRIEAEFGCEVGADLLFEHPTVRAMADLVAVLRGDEDA